MNGEKVALATMDSQKINESEDERIRKAIIDYLTMMWGNCQDDVCGVHVEDAIQWLEKQGGQKPTLRERYENIAQSEWFKKTHNGMSVSDEEQKWTEEDKSKVEEIVYFLDTAKTHYASTKALDDCIDWLKSLQQRTEGQQ